MPSFHTKIAVLLLLVCSVLASHDLKAIPTEDGIHSTILSDNEFDSDTAVTIAPEPLAEASLPQANQNEPNSDLSKANVTFPTKDVLLNWLNLLFVMGVMLVLLAFVSIKKAKGRS